MVHRATDTVCPRSHRAFALIGRRWTGAILLALSGGAERFSMLHGAVPGLSDRMLSQRLKELEADGIVQRIVTPTTPVIIAYRLTEKGKALQPMLDAVSAWAQDWLPAGPDDAAPGAEDGANAA